MGKVASDKDLNQINQHHYQEERKVDFEEVKVDRFARLHDIEEEPSYQASSSQAS